MEQSDCYNPFKYIREEVDVVKLVTNLISNTTPKNSQSNDPFWEKAEGMFLQSLFYYVWLECPQEDRNFRMVLKLIGEAEVKEDGSPSELDRRMKRLERKKGINHPAIKQYNKVFRGAADTVRSIVISANSRLAFLENPQILRILSKDDMNIEDLGIGINGDGKTRTALFCVIPDSDKTYNSVVGLLYSQIFQELYYQADFVYGGKLPVPVLFLLDEFANVALPDDFCSLLSTMRSRRISATIIIQNLAQIKALFEKTWETLTGNCDTTIYLGGNEQSTHEYISKLIGKATIDKKSAGETKGKNGSSSRNYDVLGRELYTPDEVRKMDNRQCMVFIRGQDPVLDNKYNTPGHILFKESADGGGEAYVHVPKGGETNAEESCSLLNKQSFEYFQRKRDQGEKVYLDDLSGDELLGIDNAAEEIKISSKSEIEKNKKIDEIEQLRRRKRGSDNFEKEFEKRLMDADFSVEQLEEARLGLKDNLDYKEILKYFLKKNSAEEMHKIRLEMKQNK